MANKEKVVFSLVLDDSQLEKVLDQLPAKYKKEGVRDGKAYSKGLKSGLKFAGGAFKSVGKSIRSFTTSFAGLGAALGVGFGLKAAINEASNLESSLKGLKSIARAFNSDVDAATEAAINFSKDGIIPLADSVGAMKLLLANFNGDMDRSVKTFKVMRDAAAFNRQSHLDLGQAIVTASEGLKNDLSIKTDNIGITKNLSIMQKEYAKTIGTTAGKLTQAQKATAEFVGFQKEGAIFTGDYIRSLDTFGGTLSKVTGRFRFFLAAVGNLIVKSPVAKILLLEVATAIEKLTNNIKDLKKEGDPLSEILIMGIDTVVLFSQAIEGVSIVFTGLFRIANIVINGIALGFQALAGAVVGIGRVMAKALNFVGVKNAFLKDTLEVMATATRDMALGLKEDVTGIFNPTITQDFAASLEALRVKLTAVSTAVAETSLGGDNAEKEGEQWKGFFTTISQGAKSFETDQAKMNKSMVKFGKTVQTSLIGGFANATGQAFGAFGKALKEGDNAFKAFTDAFLSNIGSMMIQLGTSFILQGIAWSANPAAPGSGGPLIAAGAALATAGGVLSAVGGGGATGGGSGGGIEGGGITASAGEVTDFTDDVAEPDTTISVTIQGDVLDSQESGTRIVSIINDAFDKQGITIRSGAVA